MYAVLADFSFVFSFYAVGGLWFCLFRALAAFDFWKAAIQIQAKVVVIVNSGHVPAEHFNEPYTQPHTLSPSYPRLNGCL